MPREVLTLACGDYESTRVLAEGRVTIDGGALDVHLLPAAEILEGAADRRFDIVEHSLATVVMESGARSPYVPLPVFSPSVFRHGDVYVRLESAFMEPSHLAGGRVGITGYCGTTMVWARGIFAEHQRLPIDAVTYVVGGLDAPRTSSMHGAVPPAEVTVEDAPEGITLVEMLMAGDLEAIYSPRPPERFSHRVSGIRRMYPDVAKVEREFFERTGVVPIMHVMAVRRDVYAENPWIKDALASALLRAAQVAVSGAVETVELRLSAARIGAAGDVAKPLPDAELWANGIDHNSLNLRTFVRYAHDQGLVSREVELTELFAAFLGLAETTSG